MDKWFPKQHISVELLFDAEPPLYILYPHAKLPGSQAPKTTSISGRFRVTLKKPDYFEEVVAKLTPNYSAKGIGGGNRHLITSGSSTV